jgi:hypothetical protein
MSKSLIESFLETSPSRLHAGTPSEKREKKKSKCNGNTKKKKKGGLITRRIQPALS